MGKKNVKTNAMRILERNKVPYEVVTYEVDESDLSGEHVAKQLNIEPKILYKTLVLQGDKIGYLVACIPVHQNIDLKKLARVSGNKKVEMIAVKDLLGLTGYIRGGCSPIGMKKQFPTYIQKEILQESKIGVSAGQRGMQMMLTPKALVDTIKAKVEDIILD